MVNVRTHQTSPQESSRAQSRWPVISAFALTGIAVGLTIWTPIAVVSAAVGVWAAVKWMQEFTAQHTEIGTEPRHTRGEEAPTGFWARLSKQEWGAIAFMGASLSFLIANFRAAQAHGLFLVAHRLPVLRDIHSSVTLFMTLLLAGSAITAVWGHGAIARGDRRAVARAAGGTLVLGTVFIVGRALEFWALVRAGFDPTAHPQTATFFSLTATHAALTLAGLAFFALVLARARSDDFSVDRDAASVRACVIYWGFVVVTWGVIYLLVYLALIPLPEHLAPGDALHTPGA